jgi:hypothetical protein
MKQSIQKTRRGYYIGQLIEREGSLNNSQIIIPKLTQYSILNCDKVLDGEGKKDIEEQ